jgi:hypothetical protein
MSERTGFIREVCEAKDEMEKAMARYVLGSSNLLRALVTTMEKSLAVYADFDAKLATCIIESPARNSKRRFRDIMDTFDHSIFSDAVSMQTTFASVRANTNLKLVEAALGIMEDDATMALEFLRGVPKQTRLLNFNCRVDRINSKESFIKGLSYLDDDDLKKARETFGEEHAIPAMGIPDRTAENKEPPASWDLRSLANGWLTPRRFRRKSV